MKWKCTYAPEEEREAAADLNALLRRHPGAKVRRSAAHQPQKSVYLTTKKGAHQGALAATKAAGLDLEEQD